MELPEIQQVLGKGLPGFRARQIYDALYRQRVSAVEEITNLPQALRREIGLPIPARLSRNSLNLDLCRWHPPLPVNPG